jgi:transcriptional regulator with XRE-family HTH domain
MTMMLPTTAGGQKPPVAGVVAFLVNGIAQSPTASNLPTFWLPERTSPNYSQQPIPVAKTAGTIGATILEVRRLSGLTWEELAQILEVSRRTLHHWANGKPQSAQHEQRLQRLLGVLHHIDRGEAALNRSLLMTAHPAGGLMLDLLRNNQFQEVKSYLGEGQAERRQQRGSLPKEAQELRRPPAVIDLMESLADRLPETGTVILRKPTPRPEI